MDGHSPSTPVLKLQAAVSTKTKLLYFQYWSCSSLPLPNNNHCTSNINSQSTTADVFVTSWISIATNC